MSDQKDSAATGASHTEVVEPEFSPDGVDLTLIRWMLSLTPAERLQALQQNVRSLEKLRRAAGRA